jgi:hypothetical protein
VDNFPVINLPDYFTVILASNMQVSGQNFIGLQTYIHSKPPLTSLVKKIFHDIGPNIEVGSIIKSLGWIGFRNRITNAFLEYEMSGHFPATPDSSLLVDLINLEEDLKSYEVSGYSRGFLLGFYIKMIEIQRTKLKLSSFSIDLNYIPFLDFSASRFPRIDWSYLMILHFNEFLGESKLKKFLVDKVGFDKIYSEMSDDHKGIFAQNLLSYGCSIGESDIFYATQV